MKGKDNAIRVQSYLQRFCFVQKRDKLNSAGTCEFTKKFIPNSLVDVFLLIRL